MIGVAIGVTSSLVQSIFDYQSLKRYLEYSDMFQFKQTENSIIAVDNPMLMSNIVE